MDKSKSEQSIRQKLNELAKKANSGDEDAIEEFNRFVQNTPEAFKIVSRLKRRAKRRGKQDQIAMRLKPTKCYGSVRTSLSGSTSAKTWKKTK